MELFVNGIMKDKNIYGVIVIPKEKDMSKYILKRNLKGENISVKERFEIKGLIYHKENIFYKKENIGTVEVFMSKEIMNEELRKYTTAIIVSILIVDFVMVFFIYVVLLKFLINPLINLENYAKNVSSENFENKDKKSEIFLIEIDSVQNSIEKMVEILNNRYMEIKESKKSLAESERNYREIFNSTTDSIFIHDGKTGKIIDINETTVVTFGYSKDEILKMSIEELSCKEMGFNNKKAMNNIMASDELVSIQFEWCCKKKNGEIFWSEVDLRCAKITGKEIVMAVVRDISKRKEAEEALKESEILQRTIMNSTEDWILTVDKDDFSLITFNNGVHDYFRKKLGIDLKKGLKLEELVTNKEKQEILRRCYRDTLEFGNSTIEYSTEMGNRILLLKLNSLKKDNEVFGISVFGIDITERKKAEERLRESEILYKNIIDSTTDMIWAVESEKYNLITFNKSFEEYYQESDIKPQKGINLEQVIQHKKYPDIWSELYKQAIREGNFAIEYGTVRTKKIFQLNFNVLKKDDKVFGVSVFGIDITDRKKSEIELNEYKDKLEVMVATRTHQLEALNATLIESKENADIANKAKSTFLANMSHEIRTPMNSILGYAQLLIRDSSLEKEKKTFVESIYQSGNYLLSIINDVLDMSKIEAGKETLVYQETNIEQLLKEIQRMFYIKFQEKRVAFDIEICSDISSIINSDSQKIMKILINLIGNALKFTDTGSVKVKVSNKKDNSDIITYEILITDTGSGIAKLEIDKIFLPFEQSASGKKSKEGTGLGLAISKKHAVMLGGDITVKSIENIGSEFLFTFKAEKIDKKSEEKIVKGIYKIKDEESKRKIVIVDDVVTNRKVLSILLKNVGFTVYEAEDGEEAIKITEKELPDLMLIDKVMPGIDGIETLKRLKSKGWFRNTKAIMISASAFEEDEKEAREIGFDGFIKKPFITNELLSSIGELLGISYLFKEESSDIKEKSEEEIFEISATTYEILKKNIEEGNLKQLKESVTSDLLEHNFNLSKTLMEYIEDYDLENIKNTLNKCKVI